MYNTSDFYSFPSRSFPSLLYIRPMLFYSFPGSASSASLLSLPLWHHAASMFLNDIILPHPSHLQSSGLLPLGAWHLLATPIFLSGSFGFLFFVHYLDSLFLSSIMWLPSLCYPASHGLPPFLTQYHVSPSFPFLVPLCCLSYCFCHFWIPKTPSSSGLTLDVSSFGGCMLPPYVRSVPLFFQANVP